MTDSLKPASQKARSKDFRTIAADAFGVRASDNLIQLMLSLETGDFQTGDVVYQEEALLLLTPRSLKVLSIVLANTLRILETVQGPILLPEGKEEELNKAAEMAIAKPKKSQGN